VHLQFAVVLAGIIVGFAVGLTGMGGGALMTPVLVLLLGVHPSAAVSSDLVASVAMKPVGGFVHLRQRTIDGRLVLWLAVASAPAAFLGAYLLHAVAGGKALQTDIEYALAAALTLACLGIVAKTLVERRRPAPLVPVSRVQVRPLPTLAIGAVGGFIVGMTSVGSGSLMLVALMFLYPRLGGRQLVGTDLAQSIPLVIAAAAGQAVFGHVEFGLTASLLIGSLPAVYFGARLSSRADMAQLRPVITAVLLLSALKLFGVSTLTLGVAAAVGLPAAAGFLLVSWYRRGRAPADLRREVPVEPALVPAPRDRARSRRVIAR
jgi:uncharacterized membrane protein YfcA